MSSVVCKENQEKRPEVVHRRNLWKSHSESFHLPKALPVRDLPFININPVQSLANAFMALRVRARCGHPRQISWDMLRPVRLGPTGSPSSWCRRGDGPHTALILPPDRRWRSAPSDGMAPQCCFCNVSPRPHATARHGASRLDMVWVGLLGLGVDMRKQRRGRLAGDTLGQAKTSTAAGGPSLAMRRSLRGCAACRVCRSTCDRRGTEAEVPSFAAATEAAPRHRPAEASVPACCTPARGAANRIVGWA